MQRLPIASVETRIASLSFQGQSGWRRNLLRSTAATTSLHARCTRPSQPCMTGSNSSSDTHPLHGARRRPWSPPSGDPVLLVGIGAPLNRLWPTAIQHATEKAPIASGRVWIISAALFVGRVSTFRKPVAAIPAEMSFYRCINGCPAATLRTDLRALFALAPR